MRIQKVDQTDADPGNAPAVLVTGHGAGSPVPADVLDRLAAMKEENAFLRSVLSSMFNAVLTVDDQGLIRTVNHAATTLLGCAAADLIGHHLSEVMPACHFGQDGDVIGDLLRAEEEQSWTNRQGKPVPVLVSSSVVVSEGGGMLGAVCVAVDLRERKLLEANLRHAQKMESVGTLASGIAHEINTPIQYVSDTVRFLQESFAAVESLLVRYREHARALAVETDRPQLLPEWEEEEDAADWSYLRQEVPRAFERALDGTGRVATIVRAMKDFAHPHQGAPAPADLNRAIGSTLAVARNEYKYVADLATDLGELPPVICLVGDLNQVFLNLLVNAAHAIQDVVGTSGTRGRIGIRTFRAGREAVIQISDSGSGIPAGIRHRIFDPFFTTKGVGKGTGQGLAIARAIIVEKHHGSITFDTEIGRGTTFTIRLPIEGACGDHMK
jgi:two-component system, NtrC family, sensor kinase